MTKGKRNRSSGATAYLALVAAGIVSVGKAAQEQLTATPLMVIAVAVLIIYVFKIRKGK